ncbi:hypothetical protein AX16_007597 [Volvariella volvacea WC 439]|nr:hypothetical protein AX16_007597 [Volvariella volvacea WC 439]
MASPVGSVHSPQPQYFPINKLPVEVLCRIFKQATQENSHWDEFLYRSRMSSLDLRDFSPIAVTHVCRHWRRVAIAEPTLWSTIEATGVSESTFQRVQLYLARSGSSCLLDITYMAISALSSVLSTQRLEELMKIFVHNISRWRRINFSFVSPEQCNFFSNIPPNSTANLIAATFNFQSRGLNSRLNAWNILRSAPALTELCVLCPTLLGCLAPPWDRVTRLFLSPMEANLLKGILRQSPNLTELYASLIEDNEDCTSNEASILLPKLLTLYPDPDAVGGTSSLLGIIKAPLLEHLNVNNHDLFPGVFNLDNLHDFLSYSGCNLKSLLLSDIDIPDHILARGLRSIDLQSLEELRLRAMISDKTVWTLTLAEDGNGVCPRLRHIELFRCMTSRDGLVGDCIKSRVARPSGLVVAKIQLDKGTHKYVQDIQVIKQCDTPSRSISYELY